MYKLVFNNYIHILYKIACLRFNTLREEKNCIKNKKKININITTLTIPPRPIKQMY